MMSIFRVITAYVFVVTDSVILLPDLMSAATKRRPYFYFTTTIISLPT